MRFARLARTILALLGLALITGLLHAAPPSKTPTPAASSRDKDKDKDKDKPKTLSDQLEGLSFRTIGPFRGGRAIAVTGVRHQPNVFYFGAAGGGVWKTTDGGSNWEVVSDKDFKTGSVGAIAVAESDPNVVYVGMGGCCRWPPGPPRRRTPPGS